MRDQGKAFPTHSEHGSRAIERIECLLVEMGDTIERLQNARFRTAIQQAAGLTLSIAGIAVLVGMVPMIEIDQMGVVAMTVFFAITGVAYGFRILLEAMELGSAKSKEMNRWTAKYIAASISEMELRLFEIGGWDQLGRRTQIRVEKLFREFKRALPDRVLQEELMQERVGGEESPIQKRVRHKVDALLRLPS